MDAGFVKFTGTTLVPSWRVGVFAVHPSTRSEMCVWGRVAEPGYAAVTVKAKELRLLEQTFQLSIAASEVLNGIKVGTEV